MHRRIGSGLIAACVAVVALTTGGCTMRMAYEAVRQGARSDCQNEPTQEAEERCLERTQDSYDEYQRKRTELATQNARST